MGFRLVPCVHDPAHPGESCGYLLHAEIRFENSDDKRSCIPHALLSSLGIYFPFRTRTVF